MVAYCDTWSFNLNPEVVVVGANNVVAAVPVNEHADAPNDSWYAKACSYPCHAQKAGTAQIVCDPLPRVKNRSGGTPPGQHFHAITVHLDRHEHGQNTPPTSHCDICLQLEPGKDEVDGANSVVSAEPEIQHADTLTSS